MNNNERQRSTVQNIPAEDRCRSLVLADDLGFVGVR
jgi:hypothetical protein